MEGEVFVHIHHTSEELIRGGKDLGIEEME